MGMSIRGIDPQSEVGRHFHVSIWEWRPLVDLTMAVCPERFPPDLREALQYNEGAGLSRAASCRAVASKLIVVATVDEVRLVFEDRLVARHRRCWGRERTFFDPVHYLALLERKPGGFDHARPLEDWPLPECFILLRRRLEADDLRHGTRSFIRVLRLLEKFSLAQLTGAVEYALDIDVIDADSLRTIAEHRSDRPVELFPLDGRPHLAHVRVEVTDLSAYQVLLEGVAS